MGVHSHIHSSDGSEHLQLIFVRKLLFLIFVDIVLSLGKYSYLSSVLQLDGDCLVTKFHQEANQLHSYQDLVLKHKKVLKYR